MVHEKLLAFFNTVGASLTVGLMLTSTLVQVRLLADPKALAAFVQRAIPLLTTAYWAGAILFVLSDVGLAAQPAAVPDPIIFALKELSVAFALLASAYLMFSVAPLLRKTIGKAPSPYARRLQEKAMLLRLVTLGAWFLALIVGEFVY
jgi:hypothetical protein